MRKNNKRAFLISMLSIVLCLSMLVGTTFAWFTDTDTTAVNEIKSGTLDIEIIDGTDLTSKSDLKFADKYGETDILWEPGATFKTETFRLQNKGDLYLKFKVQVNNTEVSHNKLNEVITYTLHAPDGVVSLDTMEDKPLAPGAIEGPFWIQAHMDENAGNEYQGLTLEGISFTVLAAQYTKEVDMTNDQYDAQATYDEVKVATNQSDLSAALASTPANTPTVVELPKNTELKLDTSLSGKDITFKGDKTTVIDTTAGIPSTNNANLTFDGVTVNFSNNNYKGFTHSEKVIYKNATIVGQQTMYAENVEFINCTFKVEGDAYNVWTYGAKNVTFTNCTFNTDGKAVLVYTEGETHATITLNDCTFNCNGNGYSKAAVEVGSSPNSADTTYNIIINNCTAGNGFTQNKSTSNLWGNKNSMDKNHLNVVIDGVDVY